MGLADDAMASDAEFLMDSDGFAETATFTPKGGSPRTINVIILRKPAQTIPGTPSGVAPVVDVMLANHATKGATSITVGGDSISFPARVGDTPAAYDITEVLGQSGGRWKVRLRTKR